MNYEEYLKQYLCGVCHIGFLKPHPEQADNKDFSHTLKCTLCGYTIKESVIIPPQV